MRLLVVLLSCGLAAVRSQPWGGDPEAVDIDHMIALLGEGGLLESAAAVEDSPSSSQSVDVHQSESSYFISTGGDSIKEITVAEAADHGLTCMPARALSQSADIIVQESVEDDSTLTTVSSSDGAAATAATEEAVSASASAGAGGVATSTSAGTDASAASAAAGTDASAASAGAGTDASAASAAASGSSVSASSSTGESSSDSTQLGYEIEEGEEDYSSEEVEEVGTCVPYYLCGIDDIMSDGAGKIDIRFGGDDEDSKSHSLCPELVDVYCRAPLSKPNPEYLQALIEDHHHSCGRRNPDGISVLFGGFEEGETQFGEYPWMGIVLEEELFGDRVIQRYVCGASLIHPQVVMTGAHCINGKEPTKLTVRLGEWDTEDERELFSYEEHRVASMEVHERFNSANLRYDVGLLFLEAPVVLKPHIDTICLPEENENFDYSYCVATGFGKDRFHGGRFQNILKQVDLPIMPHRQCQNRLRETRLGHWFRLHRTFTCAGGEDSVDTCRGDGGGPLVCPSKEDPTRYVQAGIVAWGIGCGEGGVPGVYASVPKLVKWVNTKMAAHGFGPSQPPQPIYGMAPPV